jgi:DNA-binding XRE family transcriptional regulator
MPNNPAYLDLLLQIAALYGADAAWLIRGVASASLRYDLADEVGELLVQRPDELDPSHWPATLIARFPRSDIAVAGLEEIKLPRGQDQEIQIAALLSAVLDRLTRIGPNTTVRVVEWAFDRYGIEHPRYGGPWQVRDRRPPPKDEGGRRKDEATTPRSAPLPPSSFSPLPSKEPLDPRVERGRQLRERRQSLGLSQHDLAMRAEIHQALISRIERGKADADTDVWGRIEAALEAARKEQSSE